MPLRKECKLLNGFKSCNPPLKAAEMQNVDVAIAGGGPAGLAAANAIRAVFGDSVEVKVCFFLSILCLWVELGCKAGLSQCGETPF